MLKLAAERADGAHPYNVNPEHTAQARAILGQGPYLCPEQAVVLETDPAKAREIARDFLGIYLALPNYTDNFLRLGFDESDIKNGGSDRLIDSIIAWGDLNASQPHSRPSLRRRGPRLRPSSFSKPAVTSVSRVAGNRAGSPGRLGIRAKPTTYSFAVI